MTEPVAVSSQLHLLSLHGFLSLSKCTVSMPFSNNDFSTFSGDKFSASPITSSYINSLNSSNVPSYTLSYKVKEYSFCLALTNLHDKALNVYVSFPFSSLPFQELKNLSPEPSLSDIELFTKELNRKHDENGKVVNYSVRDRFVLASLDDNHYPEVGPLASLFKAAMISYEENMKKNGK